MEIEFLAKDPMETSFPQFILACHYGDEEHNPQPLATNWYWQQLANEWQHEREVSMFSSRLIECLTRQSHSDDVHQPH